MGTITIKKPLCYNADLTIVQLLSFVLHRSYIILLQYFCAIFRICCINVLPTSAAREG